MKTDTEEGDRQLNLPITLSDETTSGRCALGAGPSTSRANSFPRKLVESGIVKCLVRTRPDVRVSYTLFVGHRHDLDVQLGYKGYFSLMDGCRTHEQKTQETKP